MIGLARLIGILCVCAAFPVQAASVFVASQTGAELARIEPGADVVAGKTRLGFGPAVVATDGRGKLYLSHPDDGAITVVDASDSRVVTRLSYKGRAFGLAAGSDGRFVYVGDWSKALVSRISTETGAVEGTVAVGEDPANLILDRRGRLYVADRKSHQVSVIDTAKMERIATVRVGTAPFALGLSPSQDRLYVANVLSNDVTVIETVSLKAIATIPVGPMPYGVATSADGRLVLVTNQHAGTVSVLDAESLQITHTIKVGQYPEGVVVAGGHAYVANWFSDDVSVIDLAMLAETRRLKVAEGPRTLCIVGSSEAEPIR